MRAERTLYSDEMRPLLYRLLFAAVLIIANIFLYSPALNRVFAGDQIVYFAELKDDHSFSAGLKLLDYNVDRQLEKGDETLYRPGLFFLLASENTLFHYNYRAWNIVNLAIHILIAYLLFELLLTLYNSWLAAFTALLFSAIRGQAELVMWSHLGGYLASFAFFLAALICARKTILGNPAGSHKWLIGYVVCTMFSMLFYEMGVIAAPLTALYLWLNLPRTMPRKQTAVILLLPLALFSVLYIKHLFHCNYLGLAEQYHLTHDTVLTRLENSLTNWGYLLVNCSAPWRIVAYARFLERAAPPPDWKVYAMVILYGVLLFNAVASFRHSRSRERNSLLLTLALILFFYVLGASYFRGISLYISYYLYFFCLISLISLYALTDFPSLPWSRQLLQGGALAALLLFNDIATYHLSRQVHEANVAADVHMQHVAQLVAEHKNEPDFSFSVRNVYSAQDPEYNIYYGFSQHPTRRITVPVSQLLYPEYFDASHPKYVISGH